MQKEVKMMRSTAALLLILLIGTTPAPASAQEPVQNPRLQERLRNIPQEVDWFSRLHPLPLPTGEGPQAAASAGTLSQSIRAKVLATSFGTHVTITLHGGEQIHGSLAEVTETNFTLRVSAGEGASTTVRQDFSFEEVTAFFWGSDPLNVPIDKRVEVRLIDGDSVKGHVTALNDGEITVDNEEFIFDEVLSVKELGMEGWKKGLIIGGAVAGGLLLMAFIAYSNYPG